MSMKKRKQLTAVGLVLAILCLIFIALRHQTYQPSTLASNSASKATISRNFTEFKGLSTKPLVIFYPGALVEPNSYSIWAQQLSKHGYRVAIAHFPMDFALLAVNRADQYSQKTPYVIGGHSLGGVCAARYANKHQKQKNLKGVFFLASYADQKGNLSKTKLPVLQVTATNDGVIKKSRLKQNAKYLPQTTTKKVIKGGNHAGFGSYGAQKGDKKATISNASQQRQVAQLLLAWLAKIK